MKTAFEIYEGFKFNRLLFFRNIGEDAFKNVGAIVWPHINANGDILDI
jgi:hypothetical protein